MNLRLSLCFIIILTISIQKASGQGWLRALTKSANKADDAARVADAVTAAEKAVVAAKASRWTKVPSWAIEAKKTGFWFTQLTDDLYDIDGFFLLEGDKLVLRSNLRADASSVKIVTASIGRNELNTLEVDEFVKVLISDEGSEVTSTVLNNAYKKMRIKVDPAIFEKIAFEKIDWGDRNSIYLFDGENSYLMKPIKNAGGRIEPMIELEKNFYKRIIPDEFCTTVEYAGILYDATMFLTNASELEIVPDGIQTNIDASNLLSTNGLHTIGSFISGLTSAGYTVIDVTCQADEMIEKYVFEVFEEPDESDIFLAAADKVGDIEVTVKPQKTSAAQREKTESDGMATGWKILIGIIVVLVILGIIGAAIEK